MKMMDTLMSDSQVQTVEDWNRLLQNNKMSFSDDMATVWNKVNSDYLLQIRYVYTHQVLCRFVRLDTGTRSCTPKSQ